MWIFKVSSRFSHIWLHCGSCVHSGETKPVYEDDDDAQGCFETPSLPSGDRFQPEDEMTQPPPCWNASRRWVTCPGSERKHRDVDFEETPVLPEGEVDAEGEIPRPPPAGRQNT